MGCEIRAVHFFLNDRVGNGATAELIGILRHKKKASLRSCSDESLSIQYLLPFH